MKESYHDSIYNYELMVNAGEVCPNGFLSLKNLMLLFQQIALSHYTSKAESWTNLVATKKSWVITKIEINLKRLPILGEEIKLSTWSFSAHSFKGKREFEIFDQNGNLIITANTSWVYLDLINKAPTRFPAQDYPDFTQSSKSNFSGADNSWRLTNQLPLINEKKYPLRYTDFDINKHLNNTAYFELLEDYLNAASIKPKNIKALFKIEVLMGTTDLLIRSAKDEKKIYCEFNNGDKTSFIAEATF